MNVMTNEGLRPQILAIAGGSCSGKTSLSRIVHERVGKNASALLQLDRYYRNIPLQNGTQMDLPNFDHPDALDLAFFGRHLAALKRGEAIDVPIYNYALHRRQDETELMPPKPLIVVEGHLVLHDPNLRALFDLSCYIECPEDIRLERRIARDGAQRGRNEASVRQQFAQTVGPMHEQFVRPSKVHADRVVSQDEYCVRTVALVDSIIEQLEASAALGA
ncbi:MAG: uridine kinase [Pseudomonadota bacterium]